VSSHLFFNVPISLEEVEIATIKATLAFTNGNRREAAKLMRISRRSLYSRMKRYDINQRSAAPVDAGERAA